MKEKESSSLKQKETEKEKRKETGKDSEKEKNGKINGNEKVKERESKMMRLVMKKKKKGTK